MALRVETPDIYSDRLVSIVPLKDRADVISGYFNKNSERFSEFSSYDFRSNNFSVDYFSNRLSTSVREFSEGSAFRFFSFLRNGSSLLPIGDVSFTRVMMRPFYMCFVGFRVDKDFEGLGYATEMVSTAIRYCFLEKNIHRIMASYHPLNTRSERVLKKIGFNNEGLFKKYIFIDGEWRDQILSSLINPKWKEEKNVPA